jgi:hypothetical protein
LHHFLPKALDLKNWKTGQRKTVGMTVKQGRCLLLILLLLAHIGCSDTIEVIVEIDNQNHRKVYLEHLKSSGLKYKINSDGSFQIDVVSREQLNEKMKGFDEFVNAEIRKENERLKQERLRGRHNQE